MRFFTIISLSIGLFFLATSAVVADRTQSVSSKVSSKGDVQKSTNTASAGIQIAPQSDLKSEPKSDPKSLVMPVNAKTGASIATGKIVVQFQSKVEMRASRAAGTDLFSAKGNDALPVTALITKYGATIRQAIDLDPRILDELRSQAQLKTRKPAIDLAGMMYIEGIEPSQLVSAAREFLMLPDVLWVDIEKKIKVAGGDPVKVNYCDACGQGDDCFSAGCDFPHVDIVAAPPTPQGGTLGVAVPPEIPPSVGYCSDAGVCTTVNTIRPGCALIWDEVCASYAMLIGNSQWSGASGQYDTCLSTVQPPPPGNWPEWSPIQASIVLQSSPFLSHPLVGSATSACCSEICFIDTSCCTLEWDQICTQWAFGQTSCYETTNFISNAPPTPSSGGNPFFPNSQEVSPLYDPRMLLVSDLIPMPLTAPVPVAGGIAAIGSAPLALYTTFDRQIPPTSAPGGPAPKPAFDTFQRVTGFRAGGLDIARFTSFLQLVNGGNGLDVLKNIKVALIEPSALVNHEDLCPNGLGTPSKIILESGQTPIVSNAPQGEQNLYPSDTEHGTASLGVLFAVDNTIGVTGVVPTVQPYFYPTETFENPGRILTAIANAVANLITPTTLDPNPGNVIVMPVVTFDDQPITTQLAAGNLIALGIASGVTFVVSAGNNAEEAIASQIPGTENAIVVGGVFPGIPNDTGLQGLNGQAVLGQKTFYPGSSYSRCPVSNYSTAAAAAGGTVTVSGWGEGVCTLGYGNLFCGVNAPLTTSNAQVNAYSTNRLRTYTGTWAGTSPATAQIGGVVALIQAFSKTAFELPLTPQQMHDLLANVNNDQSVFPQSGLAAPTSFGVAEFGDTLGPGEGTTAYVGGFPNLLQMARNVQTAGGGTTIDPESLNVSLVCGVPITAVTPLSIADIDQKYLKARTARPGSGSSGLGPRVFYPSGNRILDIQVIKALSVTSPNEIYRLGLSVTGLTISTSSSYVLAFIYNPVTNRWGFMPPYLQNLTGVPIPLNFTLPCGYNPADFVYYNSGTPSVAVRIVMLPFGGLGQSTIWIDQIDVRYNDPLINVTDCQ